MLKSTRMTHLGSRVAKFSALRKTTSGKPHRLQRRYVHHAGPHSRCSNRQPQVREDSGPNGSRSEQRDLGRHLQPPAGNLSAQHHACQYVRPGRRDLLRRHIADAHDGAAAGREHDRLRILRHLRFAHRSRHDLSSLSPDDSHQCLPSPSNARSREEGAHRNTGRHVDGVAQAVHDRPKVSPGRLMGELGFLTLDNRRTATIECIEDGRVLTISYEKLLEIYFQNPQFGYYFLVLTSQRLLENLARAEAIIAQNKIAPQTPFAN